MANDARASGLNGEPGRQVILHGNTVTRPTGWWTSAVHALLKHLEAGEFPYSPRVIDIDDRGREVLTFIPGLSGKDGWARIVDEHGLSRFAMLLRAYHDAVRTFHPSPDAVWACDNEDPQNSDLICHGDFGPWNIVWQENQPVGILDWDFAGPGPAIDDVAYALEYAVPFRDDETALRWLCYDRPPNRHRRMELFANAYGLPNTHGLVEQVARRQRLDITRVRSLAERGLEPQATWVRNGYLDQLQTRVNWTEQQHPLF